eukprot:COSAG05_NODE_554_length_8710_cov_178.656137_6_plen_57_part_00
MTDTRPPLTVAWRAVPYLHIDMESPSLEFRSTFEVVYCYGLLYDACAIASFKTMHD